jgi:hypothetical protein
LHDVAWVVFEEGAPNVAEFLGRRTPFGASVQQHFDAFESLGFFIRFSVGAPRRPVLRPAEQAVKRGGAAEGCVINHGRICLRKQGAEERGISPVGGFFEELDRLFGSGIEVQDLQYVRMVTPECLAGGSCAVFGVHGERAREVVRDRTERVGTGPS